MEKRLLVLALTAFNGAVTVILWTLMVVFLLTLLV
jgi:hypothetical protein